MNSGHRQHGRSNGRARRPDYQVPLTKQRSRQRLTRNLDIDAIGMIAGVAPDEYDYEQMPPRRSNRPPITPRSATEDASQETPRSLIGPASVQDDYDGSALTPKHSAKNGHGRFGSDNRDATNSSTSSPPTNVPRLNMEAVGTPSGAAGYSHPAALVNSGRMRDRYGFLIPENLRAEYRAWRVQNGRENDKKIERYSHILNSDSDSYLDKELGQLIRSGVPPLHRRKIWARLAGIDWEMQHRPDYYRSLLDSADSILTGSAREQIGKDLGRTFPDNKRMANAENEGKLRNILRAYAVHDPENGYCQGMNFLVSSFLILGFDEEEAFWMLCHVLRQFPFNFDTTLSGCTADTEVFAYYLRASMPKLHRFFARHSVDPALYFTPFVMTLYVGYMQYESTFRIWDRIMYNGPIEFFRCTLKMLNYMQSDIMEMEGSNNTEIVMRIFELLKSIVDLDVALASMPGKQRMEDGALQFRRQRARAALRGARATDALRRAAVMNLGVSPTRIPADSLDAAGQNGNLRRAVSIKRAKEEAIRAKDGSSATSGTGGHARSTDSDSSSSSDLPFSELAKGTGMSPSMQRVRQSDSATLEDSGGPVHGQGHKLTDPAQPFIAFMGSAQSTSAVLPPHNLRYAALRRPPESVSTRSEDTDDDI